MSQPQLTSTKNSRPRRFHAHLEGLKGEIELMVQEIESLRKERDQYKAKVGVQAKELQDVRHKFVCERCTKGNAIFARTNASLQAGTLETGTSLCSGSILQTRSPGKPGMSGTLRGVNRSKLTRPQSTTLQERQTHSVIKASQASQFVSHTSTSELTETTIANAPHPSPSPRLPVSTDNSDASAKKHDWSITYNGEVRKALGVEMAHTLVHDMAIWCVRFSQDGKYLAAGCWDGKAYIYDVQTGMLTCFLKNLLAKEDCIDAVCFSRDGKYLATGAQDTFVYVWEIRTKFVEKAFKGHTRTTGTVNFSPNNRLLVSASRDNTIRLWNMRYGAMKTLTDNFGSPQEGGFPSATFSPNGRYIAASFEIDQVVRIWDVRTGRLIRKLTSNGATAYDLAFTPDGSGLVGGGYPGRLMHWDVSSLVETRFYEKSRTMTILYDHDSRVEQQIPAEREFVGHTEAVFSLAISPGGRWVASGALDHSIRVWATCEAATQCILKDSQRVYCVDFSPAGYFLASGGCEGKVRIWRYSTTF